MNTATTKSKLPVERLGAVEWIVAHASCADAILAVLLVNHRLSISPERIIWLTYESRAHRELRARPHMLFLDIVPWGERDESGRLTAEGVEQVDAFNRCGALVIDHHPGARAIVEIFGPHGVYDDTPGVSAALMAFREVLEPGYSSKEDARLWEPRKLAELIGVRDTWQRGDDRFEKASELAAALEYIPFAQLLKLPNFGRLHGMAASIGPIVRAHDVTRARTKLAGASRFKVTGDRRVIAFDGEAAEASNVADLATCAACQGFGRGPLTYNGNPDGEQDDTACEACGGTGTQAEFVVAWDYHTEGDSLLATIRLRSVGKEPCLPIAQRFGGGGHPRACGFTILALPGENPASLVARLLTMHFTEQDGTYGSITSALDLGEIVCFALHHHLPKLDRERGEELAVRLMPLMHTALNGVFTLAEIDTVGEELKRLRAELDAMRAPLTAEAFAELRELHDLCAYPWTAEDPHDAHCGNEGCSPHGCPEDHLAGEVTGPRWDTNTTSDGGRLEVAEDGQLMVRARNALPLLLQLLAEVMQALGITDPAELVQAAKGAASAATRLKAALAVITPIQVAALREERAAVRKNGAKDLGGASRAAISHEQAQLDLRAAAQTNAIPSFDPFRYDGRGDWAVTLPDTLQRLQRQMGLLPPEEGTTTKAAPR